MSHTAEYLGRRFKTRQTKPDHFVPYVFHDGQWRRVHPGITYMSRHWATLQAKWAIEDLKDGKSAGLFFA